MSEQRYDLVFKFELEGVESRDSVTFEALTELEVNLFLTELNKFGRIPEYNFYGRSIEYPVQVKINPNTRLIFRIDYSTSLQTPEEMLSSLNEKLVNFLRKETEIKGFLN